MLRLVHRISVFAPFCTILPRPVRGFIFASPSRYNYNNYAGSAVRVLEGDSRDYELSVFATDLAGNVGPASMCV